MAPPIRIGTLTADEARDLVEALAVRGLIATAEKDDGGYVVELNQPHEETERLLGDLTVALETWLADRGRAAVDVHIENRTVGIEAASRLDETLRSRLRRAGASDERPS